MATSSTERTPTGAAAAALLGAGLGLLALGFSHVASEASAPFKETMQQLGALWIPGAKGIGPYAGKETVGLLVWLMSWAMLHGLFRKRETNLVIAGTLTLLLIGLATTILWPPITHLLVK